MKQPKYFYTTIGSFFKNLWPNDNDRLGTLIGQHALPKRASF